MTQPVYVSPFVDHVDIEDAEVLYRRIPQPWIDWENVDAEGRPRIRRAAFQDYPEDKAREMGYPAACMSIGLESVLRENGQGPAALTNWGPTYGIASMTAGIARSVDQGVMRWPTSEEPWHGVLFSKKRHKRTSGEQNALALASRWVHVPQRTGT